MIVDVGRWTLVLIWLLKMLLESILIIEVDIGVDVDVDGDERRDDLLLKSFKARSQSGRMKRGERTGRWEYGLVLLAERWPA